MALEGKSCKPLRTRQGISKSLDYLRCSTQLQHWIKTLLSELLLRVRWDNCQSSLHSPQDLILEIGQINASGLKKPNNKGLFQLQKYLCGKTPNAGRNILTGPMLAELLAGSEPPSRSKAKEKKLPPCAELFAAFLTQWQSPASTAIFNSWCKQEHQGSHCRTDSSFPQISGQMYFEALITGIGSISRQDCRPEDFVQVRVHRVGKITSLESSKKDRSPGIP